MPPTIDARDVLAEQFAGETIDPESCIIALAVLVDDLADQVRQLGGEISAVVAHLTAEATL